MAKIQLKEYRNHVEGGASNIPVMFHEQKSVNDEWLGPWRSKVAGGESGLDSVPSSGVKSISDGYRHYVICFDDLDVMMLRSPACWYLEMMVQDLMTRFSGYYQVIGAIHELDNPEIYLLISTPSRRIVRQQDIMHELRILENYMTLLMAQYSR